MQISYLVSELLAMAHELYNNTDLQFRQLGQRNSIIAALEDARTMIMILPDSVSLR